MKEFIVNSISIIVSPNHVKKYTKTLYAHALFKLFIREVVSTIIWGEFYTNHVFLFLVTFVICW